MTADCLSQEERVEASRKAQDIQKTINTAAGRRRVRCVALKFRPLEISSPIKGRATALSLGSSRVK
jgi:hypothetical protein